MNLVFGTENYIVKYLQTFLFENYSTGVKITGKFDKATQQALLKYLRLPNTATLGTVFEAIVTEYPDLCSNCYITKGNDEMTFTTTVISEDNAALIGNTVTSLKSFLYDYGWLIDSSSNYINTNYDLNGDGNIDMNDRDLLYDHINGYHTITDPEILRKADINLDGAINNIDLNLLDTYLEEQKLFIKIKSSGRKNIFPSSEMEVMINQFDGTYTFNKAIRDVVGNDDTVHDNKSKEYKIAIVPASPGQKFTITHGSTSAARIVIGTSTCTKENIEVLPVTCVVDKTIASGGQIVYTCDTDPDVKNIVIQVPNTISDLTKAITTNYTLQLGDLNFDGNIDKYDLKLLIDYCDGKLQLTPRQLAAADLNGDGKVDYDDIYVLQDYLEHGGILGTATYVATKYENVDTTNSYDILVIKGEYPKNLGIPLDKFTSDPWIVHDKFLNYLLGMAVTPYSESENITYVQNLLEAYYPDTKGTFSTGIFDDRMKDYILQFQRAHTYITYGDVNSDGQVNSLDTAMIEEHIRRVHEAEETGEEFIDNLNAVEYNFADVNKDSLVNEADLEIVNRYINGEEELLKNYTIAFSLGYMDVETEAEMLSELNKMGMEVG